MSLVLFFDLGEDLWGDFELFEASIDDKTGFFVETVAGVMFAVEVEFFTIIAEEVGFTSCDGGTPCGGTVPIPSTSTGIP